MCGIAGAIDLTGAREFSPQRLLSMTGAIAHRGPDDEQFHIEPGVALGARRLSIIDLAGGRQPIANEDGSIWVAFNGELFEYPELRQELLSGGHRLATRCDTEAWVHLYEDHREGMFARARGQFAVSLWDRNTRTLILGRDRVGICPLYYTEVDGWLLWGSEIKALLASGLVAARPDPRGVDHLFTFFCAGTTRTFFEGIKSLPPGHFLKVRDGRVTQHRYWDLDFPDAGSERRLDDPTPLVDELEALLQQSVERRLRSDVPVVSYISGGLDSTVVLGFCSRHRGEPIPAFTVGLDKAGPDERAHVDRGGPRLGSPLTTVTMDRSGIAGTFPELDSRGRGTGARYLVRGPLAAGPVGPPAGIQGRADRRRGRRGPGRLRLVQVAENPRRRSPAAIGPGPSRLVRKLLMSSIAGRRLRLAARAGDRRRSPRPARPLRADLPGKAGLVFDRHVAAAGRPQPLCRPGYHQRPHQALASPQPVALRRLQGHAGRPAR